MPSPFTLINPFLKELNLIGVSGKSGSGKSTVCHYFREKYVDVYIENFADFLKAAASHAFGIDEKYFYDPELKEKVFVEWGVSPRQIAQFLGTEMFRDTVEKLIPGIGHNFWIHRLQGKLTGNLILEDKDGIYTAGDTVFVGDVRFPNEQTWILNNGGILLELTREEEREVGISNHPSEYSLSRNYGITAHPNYFLVENNSTLEDLYETVDNILSQYFKFTPLEFDEI